MMCMPVLCFCAAKVWSHRGSFSPSKRGFVFAKCNKCQWFYSTAPRCSEWQNICRGAATFSSRYWRGRLNEYDVVSISLHHPFQCSHSLSVHSNVNAHYSIFTQLSFHASTLLVGRLEGHPAVKSYVLVCWWRRFDWSFARLITPVVTTTSIILSSSKTG